MGEGKISPRLFHESNISHGHLDDIVRRINEEACDHTIKSMAAARCGIHLDEVPSAHTQKAS